MSRPTPPPLSALRRERRTQSINQWLFLPILVFLLLGVNYISWRHYRRADFSLNQFQKLSGQTLNLLSHLPGEVTLTAFLAPEADATGYEPVYHDGQRVGYVTSGAYGHHVRASLALAYVDAPLCTTKDPLSVTILGKPREARLLPEPPYDPRGLLLRG